MTFIRRCREPLSLEYMTEVATTGGTSNLYAGRGQGVVFMSTDGSRDSIEESGPATTTRKLGAALVEGRTASSARINTFFLVVFVFSSAGTFCALLA